MILNTVQNPAHLRVVIDARIKPDGTTGGVQQFVTGLVKGLAGLAGPEHYVILVLPDHADWLRPFAGSNQSVVETPRESEQAGSSDDSGDRHLVHRAVAGAKSMALRTGGTKLREALVRVPKSDGFYESFEPDIVHFPFQRYVRCQVPTIFNPHDLQYLHHPGFFAADTLAWSKVTYRTACREAAYVVTPSRYVKEDIEAQLRVPPEKVVSVLSASPLDLYRDRPNGGHPDVQRIYDLPDRFAFYPAQTWPHKNHVRLMQAVRTVKDQHGLEVHLVCTGAQNAHWPVIRRERDDLGLERQVRFLGFISPQEIRALYRLAEFVIFPSLYEGAGLPVLEAFSEDAPIAASRVCSIPEYGGDAVLYLDPLSVEGMARALKQMATDRSLREKLRERGKNRRAIFTWEATAAAHRAIYRAAAGMKLSSEDRDVLADRSRTS